MKNSWVVYCCGCSAKTGPLSWLSFSFCPHNDMMLHSNMAFSLPCISAADGCPSGATFASKYVFNMKYTWASFFPSNLQFLNGTSTLDRRSGQTVLQFSVSWSSLGSQSQFFVRVGSGPIINNIPSAHRYIPQLGTLSRNGIITFTQGPPTDSLDD